MFAGLCLGTVIISATVFQNALAVNFCPSGWFHYENYCYKYDPTEVYFWEARRRCQALGADLTTMVNADETEALAKELQSILPSGRVDLWIGFYNPNPTGTAANGDANNGFKWIDGTHSDSTYDSWFVSDEGSKEPGYGDQYGRLFRFEDVSPVKWAADGGSRRKGYICKKEIWDHRKQHCFGEYCYRISARKSDNHATAQQECEAHGMTVLEYGRFPDPLKITFSVQNMSDDRFWLDYENRTECRSLSSAAECPANTAARVMCVGQADIKCPCGWVGFDDDCYYLGAKLDDTGSIGNAEYQCEKRNASLIEITSHIENLFIGSIVRGSRSYWIKNGQDSVYCVHNAEKCPSQNTILANGKWQQSFSPNSIMCKKRKEDLRRTPTDFCLDSYPGECYSFSQTTLSFSDLKLVNCSAKMKMLDEEMLQERKYLSPYLETAISSPNVTCNGYWIDSKYPKIISTKNEVAVVSHRSDASVLAKYICVKDIDECASSPCVNGGTCVDALHDFECLCEAGYIGKKCQTVWVSFQVIMIIASLAGLLGIAVIVIFILACRIIGMRRAVYDNNAEDEPTYDDIARGCVCDNPSVEHARAEQEASAGQGVELKTLTRDEVVKGRQALQTRDDVVKGRQALQNIDSYLAPN